MEEDAEIKELLADVEKPLDYGPSILPHVAVAFNTTMTRQISKETSDKIKQSIKIPENCQSMGVPKMNIEIWQNLTAKSRLTDIKYQNIQQSLSSGVATLAMISNEIALRAADLPKDFVTTILKLAMDGANLLGSQSQDITKKRRLEVKPALSPEYAGICNAQVFLLTWSCWSNLFFDKLYTHRKNSLFFRFRSRNFYSGPI